MLIRWIPTLALLAFPLAVPAQTAPPLFNLVTLNASATVELPKDTLTVVFGATREGSDAAAVQNQLKQAVEAALAEARKAAKPGQLEVQTGNLSLYPRYAPKGGINGWQGSAELIVEGRDMPAVAQLTGRINTMTISRVAYGLSREARAKVEGEVTAAAIASFRAKAEAVSRQFGFSAYTIHEVSVVTNDNGVTPPVQMFRSQGAQVMADAPLPVEAGKASVVATVSGSVQMTR